MTTTTHRGIPPGASKPARRCLPTLIALLIAIPCGALGQTSTSEPLPTPSASAAPGETNSQSSPQYALTAKRITYWANRQLLTADERVDLELPTGVHVRGQTFAMDLKLNRLVVAGEVSIQGPGVDLQGAAFARFFDPQRTYVVPFLSEPDRWTFLGDDFSTPLKGRTMPGDTFALPNVQGEKPFIIARKALIVPAQSIHFFRGDIVVAGAAIPAPFYFLNISSNPNWGEQALAGATFDGPYPFTGGAHSESSLHLRYDPIDHVYLALTQQLFVTNRSYLALSASPVTQPQRQYNAIGDDRITPKLEDRLFVQESVYQHGLSQPLSAQGFFNNTLTIGLHRSFIQIVDDFFYDSFLGAPQPVDGMYYYGSPEHAWVPNHPTDGQISWIGSAQRIWPLPLTFNFRGGYGFVHDAITPPQTLNGATWPTLYHDFAGATLATTSFKLVRDPHGLGRDLNLNAYEDLLLQSYSSPHHVVQLQSTVSLSKQIVKHLQSYASYQITNIQDIYNKGTDQSAAYPPFKPPIFSPITGEFYPGYNAFIGASTIRSLTEGLIYTPSDNFALGVTARQDRDFPQPIPGPNSQPLVGFAPYQITPQLRLKLAQNLFVTIQRSYFFHFGTQNWDPAFSTYITAR